MATPRVGVLRAPGTNCDVETAHAFESCGAEAERLHLFRLLENPQLLERYQILCIPGGFSYGDDVGAGLIFSQQLRGRLGEAIGEFLQADKLILGICNGFQVLLKSGILPGGATSWPEQHDQEPGSTLTWNDNGKYTAVWVHLEVPGGSSESTQANVFLRGIDRIELPVAHAEGRIVVRDPSVLADWQKRGQIAIRYCRPDSAAQTEPADSFESVLPAPMNPNGSVANIAGLGDPSGRILGLMPHPERFIHATQHPQWTRRQLSGDGAGRSIFRNGVEYFA